MMAYTLRRLVGLVPTLLCIVVLSFLVIRLAPGSPFSSERAVAPEVRQVLEARYGLDRPLSQQMCRYLQNLARGDLGMSTKYPQRSVSEIIAAGLPTTLTLGAASLAWALFLGIGAGALGALYPKRGWRYLSTGVAMVGLAVPTFVLGPIAVEIFALRLYWLPAAGWGNARHLVLPALTLGTVYAAPIARLTHSGVVEVMGADYVRTARHRPQRLDGQHAAHRARRPTARGNLSWAGRRQHPRRQRRRRKDIQFTGHRTLFCRCRL
jgi:oligopeptide transport system permease protein